MYIKDKYSILKENDKIGLITPAGYITKQKLDNAIQNVKNFSLEAFYYNSVLDKSGYLAGTDKNRANELHKMYADKSVKAILCVRGGYGTTRILDLLDYELIKNNPKPLIGYSDITALLFAVYKKTGLPGFHGIVGASNFSEYSKDNFKDIFLNTQNEITICQPKNNKDNSYIINPGKTEGILIGGNLSILTSLIGTKYDIDWKNKIIFIEEINEAPYKIDRMLTQLYQAGKFNDVRGIILGKFSKCDSEDFDTKNEDSFSLKEVILEKIRPLQIPAVYEFSFGHIKKQAIFPFGIKVQFDADKFQIRYKRKVLQDFF